VKLYVASSWRNPGQPLVVRALRNVGHEVYDFHHPRPGDEGFHWRDIDPDWQRWSPDQFREALTHGLAVRGLGFDFKGMRWADACVMVQPCGRSAHLELGWFVGAGKPAFVLLADDQEPELMLALATRLCLDVSELLETLAGFTVLLSRTR
jgi:hypothetical protein